MRKLPTVGDHMDEVVPTLTPDTDIRAAVAFLLQHRVTGAPVVDEDGAILGIVTAFDCLRLLAEGTEAGEPVSGTVADYMTRDIQTVSPSMDIYYVAGIFLRNRFRRLPVVHEGRLVGAITRFDILRVINSFV